MKKAWQWLKTHWYLPLTVVAALLGVVGGVLVQRKFNSPVDVVKDELAAIDAASETAAVVQKEGIDAAVKQLEETHAETLEAMDEAARARVDALRSSPTALSKALVRAGARSRRAGASRGASGER